MKLGDRIYRKLGVKVRLYSEYPFPWSKSRAPLDDFGREAIIELRRNPDKPFYRFETFQGDYSLRYATADRMKRQCVSCHNTHPQSPKTDWKIGDVRGVLEITKPLAGLTRKNRSDFHAVFLFATMFMILGTLGLVVLAVWLKGAALQLTELTGQLKNANLELDAFNYSVAHDLRTPLTILSGFSKVLLEDHSNLMDAQGRECASGIARGVDRMSRLIDDMLRFAKVTHAELERKIVDLSQTASSIASGFLATQHERKVEFKIEPGLTAYGDANLLGLVLENLIGNAWKYTGKRDRALIEIGKTFSRGEKTFFVRDNGAGFDMAQSPRLFISFQRLHSKEDFPGSGIGLATVRRIIQRHGGKVWAEGEVGKGAAFYFTLPEIPSVSR